MYSVVISWAIIAIILMLVGITVVVAGIKAKFSAGWKVVLGVLVSLRLLPARTGC